VADSAAHSRRWTLRDWLQGRPLGHPTHAMFVHFPVAFYVGALALDALSRLGRFPSAPLAASWLLVGAFAGTALAAPTGFLDWLGMVPGSRKRRWATRHMLAQLAALSIFVVDAVARWSSRGRARASLVWIGVELAGVLVLLLGQWLGGVLVYRLGMRVSTGARPEHIAATGAAESRRAS